MAHRSHLLVVLVLTFFAGEAALAAPPALPLTAQEIRAQLDELYIGRSALVEKLKTDLVRIIPVESTVLILGETGTGKEVVANAIHSLGPRRQNAFVARNTGAISEHLVESELFGHAKGSFTGASANHSGAFRMADSGTLFLDELGTMPPSLQVKLLRALEEKEVTPVGGNSPVKVDARIIAATNEDPVSAVRAGTLRRDLFFRLNVLAITLPPLRDRAEDIPLLVAHFLKKHKRSVTFSPEATDVLKAYPWPGNVRELSRLVELIVLLVDNDPVQAADLPEHIKNPRPFLDRMGWTKDQPSINHRGETEATALRRIGCESIVSLHATLGTSKKVAKFLDVPESLVLDVLRNPPKRQ